MITSRVHVPSRLGLEFMLLLNMHLNRLIFLGLDPHEGGGAAESGIGTIPSGIGGWRQIWVIGSSLSWKSEGATCRANFGCSIGRMLNSVEFNFSFSQSFLGGRKLVFQAVDLLLELDFIRLQALDSLL